MSVAPSRLNRVRAHSRDAFQLKRFRLERFWWILVEITHDIRFTSASRAWAIATKLLEGNVGFTPVIPLNSQLGSDWLNIRWLHFPNLDRFRRKSIA